MSGGLSPLHRIINKLPFRGANMRPAVEWKPSSSVLGAIVPLLAAGLSIRRGFRKVSGPYMASCCQRMEL